MYRALLFVWMLVAILVSGCSSINVSYDYDNTVDFSRIHTYAWGQPNNPDDFLANEPLLKKRIIESVDGYLNSRGYRMVDSAGADVLVVVQAGVKEKMQITNWGGSGGYYRDPWGRSSYVGRTDVNYYTEGTLVIDIVDNAKKELIWRGLGTGVLQNYSNHEKRQAAIDEYVREILNRFPPGHEKLKK